MSELEIESTKKDNDNNYSQKMIEMNSEKSISPTASTKSEDYDSTSSEGRDRHRNKDSELVYSKISNINSTSSKSGDSVESLSDSNSSDGQFENGQRSSSSDDVSEKKSRESGNSGSDEGNSNPTEKLHVSRRKISLTDGIKRPSEWRSLETGEEADMGQYEGRQKMPRPASSSYGNRLSSSSVCSSITHATHPIWYCKREGCTGVLTLLGRVETHLVNLNSAKQRAAEMRTLFPSTFSHGSLLSCSECGDRPKHGTRHATWQRLCQICGEPYAMNGFWRMHGGCNNKNMESAIELRAPLHKKKLRTDWTLSQISQLDETLSAEKKFLILAHKKLIVASTCAISDDVIEAFDGTYETYVEEGRREQEQYGNRTW